MPRIIVERNIEVPMRDGCVLRADLFRPDTPEKLPVLLNRTPYNKAMPMVYGGTLDALRAAEAGYNVMVQDCRGRFASAGVWNCFTDEARDGYDTIEWAARQNWADGNVGTYGASYMGATQWLAATSTPPSLKAMAPSITASDYHDGWTYQGGAFALFFNVSWTMAALAPARLLRERADNPAVVGELGMVMTSLDSMREKMNFMPLNQFPMFRAGAPFFFDWLAHPAYDDYWRGLVNRGASRGDQRSRAEHRRMVRHLSGRHDSQLLRDALARWQRRGARGTASDHRAVESRGAVSESRRRGRFRIPLEPGVGRHRWHHDAISSTSGSKAKPAPTRNRRCEFS